MKKQIIIIFLISLSRLGAQEVRESDIRQSDDYYWGESVSRDANEARDKALKWITDQIAVHVASQFTHSISEVNFDIDEQAKLILQSHSSATLHNVKMLRQPLPDGRIRVFCYIRKSEVEKIFNERKRLIADMAAKADLFLSEGNVAHALKLNYFALLLMNSLPRENVVYQGINYSLEIPRRINTIIQKTSFAFVSDQMISDTERQITLRVTYDGSPVSMLDYFFWDGKNQQGARALDGLSTFRQVGGSVMSEGLKLNVKYLYYESRKEFSVVDLLWDVVNKPDFDSRKTVALDPNQAVSLPEQPVQGRIIAAREAGDFSVRCVSDEVIPVAETIAGEIHSLVHMLENEDLHKLRGAYGHDPFLYKKIREYVTHNRPQPLDRELQLALEPTRVGWEGRSIRMLHQYPSIHRQTNEYLVLDFNEEGRLVDLNVSVTEALYEKFASQAGPGSDWSQQKEIVRFLEKYRTAYLTRDIETIDMIFAEEALILIGRRIEKKKLPDDRVTYQPFGDQPDYEYLRLKKSDYLSRQKHIFSIQEDIALEFSTFRILRKDATPNVYSVEMRQNYASTTYADEGYLFLLIDFNEQDPLIYIRAWQPNEWDENDLIRMGNFKLHK